MPVNCHATAITGILMLGKISVGVRKIMIGLRTRMSTARTMKVYGRSRATRTIHITRTPYMPIVLRRGLDLLAIPRAGNPVRAIETQKSQNSQYSDKEKRN